MSDFTLDTSTLAGSSFKTVPTTGMGGAFREIDFGFTQTTSGGDAEIHFWELHFEVVGESSEDV